MSKKLERQEKVYKYVYGRLINGDPPSLREVQKAIGFKAVESARNHLEALVKEGRLVRRETHSRSYALPPEVWSQHTAKSIPVLGRVQAGALTTALQEPEGYISTNRDRAGEELFALRVKGLSMRDAGILPDDLVIVRRQKTGKNGDIVVAIVDDEATVKRLRRKEKKVFLEPANDDFESLEFRRGDELSILGKVVEVRRYL